MKQQSAMQTLIEQLNVNDIYKQCMPYLIDIINEVYLPMEKEQIKNAFIEGRITGQYINFEDYYNETFNK